MAGTLGMVAIRPAAPALIRTIANLPSTSISRPVASIQVPLAYSRNLFNFGGSIHFGLTDTNKKEETSRRTSISITRHSHVPIYNRKLTVSAGLAVAPETTGRNNTSTVSKRTRPSHPPFAPEYPRHSPYGSPFPRKNGAQTGISLYAHGCYRARYTENKFLLCRLNIDRNQ